MMPAVLLAVAVNTAPAEGDKSQLYKLSFRLAGPFIVVHPPPLAPATLVVPHEEAVTFAPNMML